MDCRSCGVVNAPGRRYCRECGTRLGHPCAVCHFFNAAEDKHCGGCGRRLKSGAVQEEGVLASVLVPAPQFVDGGASCLAEPGGAAAAEDAGIAGQGVSQSEIDGLFENILDDEPEESTEGGA
jgi:hypothetical protein